MTKTKKWQLLNLDDDGEHPSEVAAGRDEGDRAVSLKAEAHLSEVGDKAVRGQIEAHASEIGSEEIPIVD